MTSDNRRISTIIRYNTVHDEYRKIISELGKYACLVPKSYIYDMISEKTGLSRRTISRALYHS